MQAEGCTGRSIPVVSYFGEAVPRLLRRVIVHVSQLGERPSNTYRHGVERLHERIYGYERQKPERQKTVALPVGAFPVDSTKGQNKNTEGVWAENSAVNSSLPSVLIAETRAPSESVRARSRPLSYHLEDPCIS